MIRNKIDLLESYNGDLVIEDGDLADTSDFPALTYYQAIRTVVSNKPGDYPLFPSIGLNLDVYKGKPVSRREAFEIAKIIKETIHYNTSIFGKELEIEPFPVSKDNVAFYINLLTVDSENSGVGVVFDSKDGNFRILAVEDEPATTKIVRTSAPPTINRRV